jgi:hypothetical protein
MTRVRDLNINWGDATEDFEPSRYRKTKKRRPYSTVTITEMKESVHPQYQGQIAIGAITRKFSTRFEAKMYANSLPEGTIFELVEGTE